MIELREIMPDAALQAFSEDEVNTIAYVYKELGNLSIAIKVARSLRENIKNPI
jgi:hypothetical protein